MGVTAVRDENWQTHVACAKTTANAVARGDDVPLAPAIVAMRDMWQTAASSERAAAPLDERIMSFLPLLYSAAGQTDGRWSAAGLFERLNSLLAALFAAKTHPPAEIEAAMKKVTARAFTDETAQQRIKNYSILVVALGAVIVFSAPWMFGWPQIILGMVATELVLSMMVG